MTLGRLWWWVGYPLVALAAGTAVLLGSGTDDGDGADWPAFTGVFEMRALSGGALVSSTWRLDWRSRDDWTLSPVDGSGPTSVATRGPEGSTSVPNEWLLPLKFQDHAIAANPRMTRRGNEVVERISFPCSVADGAPPELRCKAGRTAISEVVVYELGERNLPVAREVRYDGRVVGRNSFLELTWSPG